MSNKHPIIAHGELYAEAIAKPLGGGNKQMPREYSESKRRIINDLEALSDRIISSNEVFLKEKILCVRLEPKFEAKSYVPTALVAAMSYNNAEFVGGRKYAIFDDIGNKTPAKLYFLRTTDKGIEQLKTVLRNGERDSVDQWKRQVQSISTIDLLKPEEKIMGFSDEWESGAVEFVLHPVSSETDDEVLKFLDLSNIDKRNAQVRTYEGGGFY